MKALSIQQPWAWLIVNGYKDVENRDWPTRYRGPLFIHAGKKVDESAAAWLRRSGRDFLPTGVAVPDVFETGGIVGEARLTDCVTHSDSDWFEGDYGFVLQHATPRPFQPLRGQLGLFEVPNL